ncbi:MAG: enoyl-CoA hydratase/isomerase family protein [Oligoflexia bacterium]|nr:enoyl-CoA hydratase/isomerase family protein [Oligoflexia bacterium]
MIETFYLDRPKSANALDLATAKQISLKIKNCTGLVIASKNSKVFCSGGDLKAYSKMKTKNEGIKVNREIRKTLDGFQKAPVIIVAAVEGICIGGGCELALAADRIVASSSARFAFKQVLLSLSPGWGGAQRLLNRVSASIAFDWLTSGRWVSAQEAFRCGLIDEITSPGTVEEKAHEFILERAFVTPELILKIKEIVANPSKEEKIFESLWFSKNHQTTLKR